ncbi:MAG TPA: ATP-binding protein [Gammaproteobacteria bacterium]|nr:ATP-binding protein [Gammaproteobacteria bacterium]
MLIEFTVRNFLSFREAVSLSLVKGGGDELQETNVMVPDAPGTLPLVRSAAIYGPNAAGKSNLIKALKVMGKMVRESARESQAGEPLPVTPFLLDEGGTAQPCEFEVHFISEGVRYQYGFAATRERVTEEWLLAYPKGRPQRWIDRRYDEERQTYVWGSMDKLTGKKQLWQEATRPNALFLSTAIQLNNQQLQPVFKWFAEALHVAGFGRWHPGFSIELCEDDDARKEVVSFLRAADIDIDDIELEERKFDINALPDDMPDSLKEEISRELEGKPLVSVKTVHILDSGKKVLFDLKDESDGTQKIFALAGPWLDTLEHGYVLIIDELHDNLHPLIVRFLIKLFHDPETNPRNAQLIFTTHDTSILDQEVFRRDQIWFCEKDESRSTMLIPLTDFRPRKKVENLERGYLSGRYGALPYIREVRISVGC